MLVLVMIKQQCLSHDKSDCSDGSSSGGMAAVARLQRLVSAGKVVLRDV